MTPTHFCKHVRTKFLSEFKRITHELKYHRKVEKPKKKIEQVIGKTQNEP